MHIIISLLLRHPLVQNWKLLLYCNIKLDSEPENVYEKFLLFCMESSFK